jgi:homocysteine S-methyltransferase
MTEAEAKEYHGRQIALYKAQGVDMITALTMTNVPEAIGITQAAQAEALPVAISFTVETNGMLPTGDSLEHAIAAVDAATHCGPVYYMINCAHPTHFETCLTSGGSWTQRVRGLRANASKRSHAELDEATELDAGDPNELAQLYQTLRSTLPQLNVLGGCCGTDLRHIKAIAHAILRPHQASGV